MGVVGLVVGEHKGAMCINSGMKWGLGLIGSSEASGMFSEWQMYSCPKSTIADSPFDRLYPNINFE